MQKPTELGRAGGPHPAPGEGGAPRKFLVPTSPLGDRAEIVHAHSRPKRSQPLTLWGGGPSPAQPQLQAHESGPAC